MTGLGMTTLVDPGVTSLAGTTMMVREAVFPVAEVAGVPPTVTLAIAPFGTSVLGGKTKKILLALLRKTTTVEKSTVYPANVLQSELVGLTSMTVMGVEEIAMAYAGLVPAGWAVVERVSV